MDKARIVQEIDNEIAIQFKFARKAGHQKRAKQESCLRKTG